MRGQAARRPRDARTAGGARLAHLEAAGGVLLVALAHPVRVHQQRHLVVAAPNLAVRGLAPHAQHLVKVGGAEHFLAQFQKPHGLQRRPGGSLGENSRSHFTAERAGLLPFPALKAKVAGVTSSTGRGVAKTPHFTAAAERGVARRSLTWI